MQSVFRTQGRDIRIDMHEPSTQAPHPAIVLLHGAGGNVGFWLDRLAPHLNSLGIALYAPHYFDRTGTVRADVATIADGIHVPQWIATIDDAVNFATARPNVDARRVAVVGVSLGAFLALALAAQLSASAQVAQRERIRALVSLSGGLAEPYAAMATRHFPPTLVLHGEADTIVRVSFAHELDRLLTGLNVAHETRTLPREGHWFSGPSQMQLLLWVAGFLKRHLA